MRSGILIVKKSVAGMYLYPRWDGPLLFIKININNDPDHELPYSGIIVMWICERKYELFDQWHEIHIYNLCKIPLRAFMMNEWMNE